jgi:XTP/dITP diphosphohydrolase
LKTRVVFASFNEGKVREASALLAGGQIELVSARECGLESLPEENYDTFLENALLKASFCFKTLSLPAIADDSGLEVFALGGRPGVHSARFCGREHDDKGNIEKLLQEMKRVADRRARFVCTLVFVCDSALLKNQDKIERLDASLLLEHPLLSARSFCIYTVGEVHGVIAHEPEGENGFGFDPVFFKPELGTTFAKLTKEQKNKISHRGMAFSKMKSVLEVLFG